MRESGEKFTVAVVQAASVLFDTEKTIDKLGRLTQEAAEQGSQLVLFPEAFIGGYPKGLTFGATVGNVFGITNVNPKGDRQKDFVAYWKSAVEIPSDAMTRLGNIAAQNKVYLVTGLIEREGGTLYCTVVFFSPSGVYLGKHRKLIPTGAERLVWGAGDGSTIPVFETPLGRMGAAICWENYMPLLRSALYSKGIQLYLAPTADPKDSWLATVRHIAVEGRCFVLSCNQFNRKKDYPNDYSAHFDGDAEAIVSRGGSCIVDPFGEVIAGPNYDSECILLASVDMDDIIRGQFGSDVVGHYSRPDVFKLLVNEEETTSAMFNSSLRKGVDNSVGRPVEPDDLLLSTVAKSGQD